MPGITKQITLSNQAISYIFRRSSRARRVRLVVHSDGSVFLTSPVGIGEDIARNFLCEKGEWVLAKLKMFKERGKERERTDGVADGGSLVSRPRLTRRDYLRYKPEALAFVRQKVVELNASFGHHYNKISVKNQKTCWGSCSRKGNLNFNYRILFLPERAQNYVIAHELCHLKEFNHSLRFWELVARVSPDHQEIRRELRKNGLRGILPPDYIKKS